MNHRTDESEHIGVEGVEDRQPWVEGLGTWGL